MQVTKGGGASRRNQTMGNLSIMLRASTVQAFGEFPRDGGDEEVIFDAFPQNAVILGRWPTGESILLAP